MPSFILRDMDEPFWRRVKAKAALEGLSVKAVIVKLLTKWLGVFLLVTLASVSLQAASHKIYVYAEPDAALGGITSASLTDSAEDLKGYIRRSSGMFSGTKVTEKRADATMLVQVVSRAVVNEEYRVTVRVTLADGSTKDITGTDVRQWKRCALQIVEALRALTQA